MINIILGLPGAGKTYVLTRKACEFLKKGYPVYSNFPLNLEHPLIAPYKERVFYWKEADELVKIESGIILMDEAQVYFNSRKWSELDPRMQYKLQQHRKDGLDIWGTCQNEARIDTVMRELVTHYYLCNKFFGSREGAKRVWGLIRCAIFYPEEIKKTQRRHIVSEWYTIRKKFCEVYDTNAKISYDQEEVYPWKHKKYFCSVCKKEEVVHLRN